ncbi:hypothetical protein ACFLZY_02385 [Patescibacteria group bacterium]
MGTFQNIDLSQVSPEFQESFLNYRRIMEKLDHPTKPSDPSPAEKALAALQVYHDSVMTQRG